MRRRLLSLGLLGLLGFVAVLGAVSAGAALPAPSWSRAINVPGTTNGDVASVSCPTVGNCTAAGPYTDGSSHEIFVVDQTNGTWGAAIEVPGLAALNSGGNATVNSISCATAGNCAVGGQYLDASSHDQAFVVSETNGSWNTAIEVPGTATLNSDGTATVNSVSCATAGNCAAAGSYTDGSGHSQAFVANETNGSWGTAIEAPGAATLNTGGNAAVNSVSCPTAGDCTAGGTYKTGTKVEPGHQQAFVVDETNGSWGTAIDVPTFATYNSGVLAVVNSVSCATPGNCAAGGFYVDAGDYDDVFVVNETNGVWGPALIPPGMTTLTRFDRGQVLSVSCATAGTCAAAGYYSDAGLNHQAFVVDETNGSWGNAIEVPFSASLNSGGNAQVSSISCASAGNCAVGGFYSDGGGGYLGPGNEQAFVAEETNGTWTNANEVPATAILNDGDAAVNSVSCATAGNCAAGGDYSDGTPFVTSSSSSPTDAATTLTPAAVSEPYGGVATLSATLTSGGNGVSAEYVSFTLNGTSVGLVATDGNGVATLQNLSIAGIDAGSYPTGLAASFVGDYGYQASTGTSSLTVSKAAQTIVISAHAPTSAASGDQFTVAATGGASENPVTYGSSGSCTNAGANFTMTSSGPCTITYDQAGSTDYSAAPELTEAVNEGRVRPPVWGNAIALQGAAPLNGNGAVFSVSCATAGNCAAGGLWRDGSNHDEAWIANETNGSWGNAIEVPGTAALNTGLDAHVTSISCPAAGNCSAGGFYTDGSGNEQVFVVDETNGSWGTAIQVPGTPSLNTTGIARVLSISCAAPGNCAVGGYYYGGVEEAFVATETNGSWGSAIEVPGTGNYAEVESVSCPTAGNCTADGNYTSGGAFVVNETSGSWGTAIQVPGIPTLTSGSDTASVSSLSCATAGNCAAGGTYTDGSGHGQAFVVNETNGSWGTAIEVPGTANATVNSVSCGTAGNCAAGGSYTDGSGNGQAFVVDETNGSWGSAIEVPGSGALNTGGHATVQAISCATAGNCSAVGYHITGTAYGTFVVDETNGSWGTAIQAPGTATLIAGGTPFPYSISCGAAGNCAAGGAYATSQGQPAGAFVVNSTATLAATALGAAAASGTYGGTTTLSATLTSGGAGVPGETVSFTLNGSSVASATTDANGVATLQNVSLAGIDAGSYPTGVAASFAGDGAYQVSTASSSLAVSKAAQALIISTHAPAAAAYGSQFTVAATGGGSGSPVIYGSSGSCTNTGAQFTVTSGTGTCTVTYDQAGSADYTAATEKTESVTAQKASQTITVTTPAPSTAAYNSSFGVAASAPGGAVSFSSSGVCTNVGATLTMTSGTGTCTVFFDRAADNNYNAAPQVSETVAAAKLAQSIQITTDAPSSAAYGTGFTVAATSGSSGNPVSYGSSGSCTNTGAQFTMTSGTGTCTVSYDQAGSANYAPATEKTESVTAQKASQTIHVTTDAPASSAYGTGFTVAATGGGSGNAVTYGSSGSCTNTGAHFTMTSGTGTCTVTYDQAASANYATAPEKTESVTATKLAQSIVFTTPSAHTYGDADFDPGATASSGSAVSYGASGACSIVGGNVHITGAGSCSVTASQAGDSNYSAAPQVQRTFSVNKAALSITANNSQKFYAQPLALGPTAFTPSGLVGSDAVSAVTLTSAGAAASAASGNYSIVPSQAVAGPNTDLADNYTITYKNGTLDVIPVGIIGLNGVSVKTTRGAIDSYDSSIGPYGPSNHGSAALVMSNGPLSFAGVVLSGGATSTQGAVTVAKTASISGNVLAGATASVLGTVGGVVTQNAPSTALSAPTVSACSAYSAKTGISGGSFSYSASTGNLTVKTGTVKLANGTYCFHTIALDAGATLSVSGPVTIDLTGKLTGANGHIANKTNLPANLNIETSFAGASGLVIAGGSHAYMTILAPATTVTFPSGSFFGTVLAGTVNLTGTQTAFHADTN